MLHLVNPQFGCTPKSILLSAQDAIHIVLIALELKYGIYDMLQHFGPCYRALFIDMPNDKKGNILLFGESE